MIDAMAIRFIIDCGDQEEFKLIYEMSKSKKTI